MKYTTVLLSIMSFIVVVPCWGVKPKKVGKSEDSNLVISRTLECISDPVPYKIVVPQGPSLSLRRIEESWNLSYEPDTEVVWIKVNGYRRQKPLSLTDHDELLPIPRLLPADKLNNLKDGGLLKLLTKDNQIIIFRCTKYHKENLVEINN